MRIQNYNYPFQNLSLFILNIFLKFRKFQPRHSYKIYSYIKERVYCVYKAIQNRNVVGPGQGSRFFQRMTKGALGTRLHLFLLTFATFCEQAHAGSSSVLKFVAAVLWEHSKITALHARTRNVGI